MSITAISFYLRNDTPSFVTWRSRLATAPDTPTCIVIHGGQFTGGVHPPNHFAPEIISPLPCSPALVRHTLLIVYFFKESISFIGSPDKCHTSVFNALIVMAMHVNGPFYRMIQSVVGHNVFFRIHDNIMTILHNAFRRRPTLPFATAEFIYTFYRVINSVLL